MIMYSRWLSLPLSTRVKIAGEFGIEKKGSIEVFNNNVIRDGYLIPDIEKALNLKAIQDHLNTEETNLEVLWVYLVDKAEGRELVKETPLSVLPAEEVKVMNKEYEERNPGKTAPSGGIVEPKKVSKPKTINKIIKDANVKK